MNTQIVEVRKNMLITHQFQNVGETSFTTRIDTVNFIPDEVVVRQITFNSVDPADPYYRVGNIYTNLVDDNWIGSFIDIGSIAPQTTFTIKKPISGEYTFQLFSANGFQFNWIGDISIQLEFVKYKTVKPDKIY